MDRIEKALQIFKKHHGCLRLSQATRLGVHPEVIYQLLEKGEIERICRGVYRLVDFPNVENEALATVALALPKCVICLLSALSFHDLTTQIPRRIDVACKRGRRQPSLEYPPIRTFLFSGVSFEYGIEEYQIDGVLIRVYSMEKTIADCFKYRNRIGLDVAIEALKIYLHERRGSVDEILAAARVCKIAKVIQPYIEGIING